MGASSLMKRNHSDEAIEEGEEIRETSSKTTAKDTKDNGASGAGSSVQGSEQPAQKKSRTEEGTGKSNKCTTKAKEGSGGADASEVVKEKTVQSTKPKQGSAENKNKDANSMEPENSNLASCIPHSLEVLSTTMPCLVLSSRPTSDSREDYSALYNRILELQANPDNSGQLALHVPASASGYGQLSSGAHRAIRRRVLRHWPYLHQASYQTQVGFSPRNFTPP
ncbi:hypothetical protein V5O48_013030 [Marasmius crinis-equi]|uniref:Uncharacterized protein n=1 Tax=Marasmius crinis-equi TaxID=585013 RepID=A0ABR3F180_9AGAR